MRGQKMERWAGWIKEHFISHDEEFKLLSKDDAYPLQGLRQECITSD